MADLAQMIGGLPPDQREALRQRLLAQSPGARMAQPWTPPQWLPEMALSMLPGSGDAMAMQESQAAGQRMADAFRSGDYGRAASSGLESIGLGLGALPFIPALGGMVKAWHASPHKFAAEEGAPFGRFDLNKIGTGEGAQAYGHGGYFAEGKPIADWYYDNFTKEIRRKLGAHDVLVDGAPVPPDSDFLKRMANTGSYDQALAEAQSRLNSYRTRARGPGTTAASYRQAIPLLEAELAEASQLKGRVSTQPRSASMYNVSLDVEPEDLLDWDAPLSQQSEKVRKAVAELWDKHKLGWRPDGTNRPVAPEMTGKAFYDFVTSSVGNARPEAASRALAEAGVPGLRYFDAGSRGKGEGSRNVVMFDDKLIKIEGVE